VRRFTQFSAVLLALFIALLVLVPNSRAQAQSTTRNFQMSLWECCDGRVTTNMDIGTVAPPAGRYILLGIDFNSPLPTNIDWSRVAAVEIDEPYTPIDSTIISQIDNDPLGLHNNCNNVPGQASQIDAALAQRAAELKALNPRARFWVNLTDHEAQFVEHNYCWAAVFNKPYIDVISADWYNVDFSALQQFYDWLAAHPAKPDQQLALIPGVFSTPTDQSSHLQGYFNYANSVNQTCNLPTGGRGYTGIYDGCRVWVVMGWLSGDYTLGNTVYRGMLDPNSQTIANTWQAEFVLPPGPAQRHARAKLLQPMLDSLLLQ